MLARCIEFCLQLRRLDKPWEDFNHDLLVQAHLEARAMQAAEKERLEKEAKKAAKKGMYQHRHVKDAYSTSDAATCRMDVQAVRLLCLKRIWCSCHRCSAHLKVVYFEPLNVA